ncbi:MAG TPA: hypothetical protein VN457_07710, partial [Chlamydiales bacterium]|nr:hypothetical protein [Chlamydiales bacterium]
SILRTNPNLHTLQLAQCKPALKPHLADLIRQAAGLKTLSVAGSLFNDQSAATLSRNSSIVTLDMSGTSLSNTGLAAIAKMHQLIHLDISLTKVTGEGLHLIGLLENLETLDLRRCKNPHSFEPLTSLKKLRELDVSNTADLTDVHLRHIAKISSLKKVLFFGCPRITADGVKHLLKALPKAEIHVGINQLGALNCAQLTQQYPSLTAS